MATAVGGSVSPLDLSSIGTDESGGVLSLEDVAWADSCLIKDLVLSDNGLDSLKYALPETFPSKTILSAVSRDDSPQESLIYPTIEGTEISGILDDMVDDVSPTNEQEGDTIGHQINNNDSDSFASRINSGNVFLPTYNENLRLVEASDSEADLEFPTFVDENLPEDIFKVWELDIPDEEDELVKQLNKALVEGSLESTPSASENLGAQYNKLVDDLISGLDDLSLSPTRESVLL